MKVIYKASSLSSPPSGISIFNLKNISVSDSSNHCLLRRRERIISTNRILASLERLRPKSVPFSDLIRRSFFGKIDTITLNSFRLECEHLDDTNLYIAIGFYLLFETFRCVLRQKDNDRDKILSHRFEDKTFLCPISFQSELLRPSSPHIPSRSTPIPSTNLTMKVM